MHSPSVVGYIPGEFHCDGWQQTQREGRAADELDTIHSFCETFFIELNWSKYVVFHSLVHIPQLCCVQCQDIIHRAQVRNQRTRSAQDRLLGWLKQVKVMGWNLHATNCVRFRSWATKVVWFVFPCWEMSHRLWSCACCGKRQWKNTKKHQWVNLDSCRTIKVYSDLSAHSQCSLFPRTVQTVCCPYQMKRRTAPHACLMGPGANDWHSGSLLDRSPWPESEASQAATKLHQQAQLVERAQFFLRELLGSVTRAS